MAGKQQQQYKLMTSPLPMYDTHQRHIFLRPLHPLQLTSGAVFDPLITKTYTYMGLLHELMCAHVHPIDI